MLSVSSPFRCTITSVLIGFDILYFDSIMGHVQNEQYMVNDMPALYRDWELCFGGTQVPEQEDLLTLLTEAESPPAFYHYCGTDDFLAEGNHAFCELCRERNIPLTSVWEAGGLHQWLYWDRQLPNLLNWLEAPQSYVRERIETP